MTTLLNFSSRATPDRDLPLPVYRELVVSLYRGASRNAGNVLAYALFGGYVMARSGDVAIGVASGLLIGASLLRAGVELTCWRTIADGDNANVTTAADLERGERRYFAVNTLFALALALVEWCVLTRPGGEPFRLITVAAGLIFLVSAPGRGSGAPRAVAMQTALMTLGLGVAMVVCCGGGGASYFTVLMNLLLFRHLRETTRALHGTMVSMLLAQRAAQDVADKFDAALNNMGRGLLMIGKDKRVQVSNQCFARMFGLPGAPVDLAVERLIADSISPLLIDAGAAQALAEFFAGEGGSQAQWRLVNGRILAFSRQPMTQGGAVVTMTDVTSEHEAEQNIQRMARFDPVTGLPNRAFFSEVLDDAIAAAAGGQGFSLLSIDLDRFKEVNDVHGHHAGDLLLAEAGARMREAVGPHGFVARFGGDEFVILLEAARHAAIASMGAALVRVLGAPYEIEGKTVRIGASAGAAIFPQDAHDRNATTLLKAADMALYDAKASGRGAVKFFVEDMALAIRRRRKLGADLRDALARGQLSLAYQPIVTLDGRRVLAVEALLRWTHPQLGAVSPSEFIPIAEETDAIVAIGAFVLEHACRDALAWPAQVRIAVNLSAAQFERGDLEATVRETLERTGLAPERLELEITESILIGNHQAVLEKLNRLNALGVHVVLDDFGVGYSSLSYLNDFTFDKVKVDQSFVRDMAGKRNAKAVSIIRAVNAIGRDLNMSVVAEGVETAEQLAALRALGVAGAQGYYFSKPAPAPEIGLLLLKEISEQALAQEFLQRGPKDQSRAAG